MWNRRTSCVNFAYVNAVGISSIFQIGDSNNLNLRSKVFALQREEPTFYSNEGNLSKYPIFKINLPQPILNEQMTTSFLHENCKINVNFIKIHGVSTSAVFHIGSTKDVVCEARIKHIRQIITNGD